MSTVTPLTIIKGRYIAPLADVDAIRDRHVEFVDGLIAGGSVLMAGRRTPADGSFFVFRGGDEDAALTALSDDPYLLGGVVEYEVVGVFTPGRHTAALASVLVSD